jgi:hypothetical protein
MTNNTKTLLTVLAVGGVAFLIYNQSKKSKETKNFANYVDDDFFNYTDEDFFNADGCKKAEQ